MSTAAVGMLGRLRAKLQAVPVAKAALISGTGMMISDAVVQNLIERPSKARKGEPCSWDYMRTAKWGMAGYTLHGPYFFMAFARVDKFFGPAANLATAMTKTAFVQVTLYPVYLGLLFTYLGVMEGVPLRCTDADAVATSDGVTGMLQSSPLVEKVWKKVPESYLGGCIFWPIANTINFACVSTHMRVPYLTVCGFFFNSFLSWLNARESEETSKLQIGIELGGVASPMLAL